VLTFEATRQSMYNVLYARVAMDTQFLDTVARMQAWARRMSHWTAVEGLEEHPGARHGINESSFFLASYKGGVVI
jgi:hypothetical protein